MVSYILSVSSLRRFTISGSIKTIIKGFICVRRCEVLNHFYFDEGENKSYINKHIKIHDKITH